MADRSAAFQTALPGEERLDEATATLLRGVFSRHAAVRAVYAFGSQVTDRARHDSDLDLGVVVADGSGNAALKMDLLADLTAAGFDDIDLVVLNQADPIVQYEAVRPNRLIYAVPDFDHGSFFSRAVRVYLDLLPCLEVQRQALKKRLHYGPS